uniref:Uncharacterized protein n=1 Tax=Fusarium oxysporum (strain Fo5176) TaxID=660025 RepID=A0A0D2YDN4_FUSOF
MSIKDHNLTLLNSREDWTNWINSIEDLAVRNDVWSYCDPEGIENLVFTVTKPSDSASKDTIQKYHSLQAIYDSERKKYDKVSDRIDLTVCQEFKQHYLGIHDVRGKLIALADSIQPTAKDQKQNVRAEFEKLKKGLSNTSLDKWLSRWPALVNNAKRYKIENLLYQLPLVMDPIPTFAARAPSPFGSLGVWVNTRIFGPCPLSNYPGSQR